MDKRYAIFDVDGTLVDSMIYWKQLAGEFLSQKGVRLPPNILEQIKPMTIPEAMELFIQTFSLEGTLESLSAEANALMTRHYQEDVPLKPGIREYLAALNRMGVRMCVASATAEPLIRDCLGRLEVLDHFQFLLSCESVGAGKDRPDVYYTAAMRLDCEPCQAAVYEDALYAASTARKAGFYVVGVYDESAKDHWSRMKALADETIFDFKEELL